MSLSFQELAGSPVEQYTLEGFSARRQFLVPWEQRDAFAVGVLGQAVEHGGRTPVNYPGMPSVVAVRLQFEPFEPEHIDFQDLDNLAEGLNRYGFSHAKATVDYQTINARDRQDGPVNEEGTQITYRMLYGAELQSVPPGGWAWEDDPETPLPDNAVLRKRIPITEHHLTWHQVVNPPWATIRELQGTVNSATFLGCAAETLLFEGAEANKVFRAGLGEDAASFCWELRYVFRERGIKSNGQVYGWNHYYREDPPGWVRITNGVTSMYTPVDFQPLFQSVSGE